MTGFKLLLSEEITFQTAKGSIYRFSGQKTVRHKTPHEFHDAGDVGLKEPSEMTVFINAETAREIGFWGGLSASKKRIVLVNDEVYLLSWNNIQNKHGLDKIIGNKKYVLQPQIGLSPLELWEKDTFQWPWVKPNMLVFKKSHPGNPITKINSEL